MAAIAAVMSVLISATAPSRAQDHPVRYEASHEAMGTVFTVAAYGRDLDLLAETVNEAFEEIDRLDRQMSNYKAESELSSINREAARKPVVVEPNLFQLIGDSVRYSIETDGAFDITVGPLMKSWGFFRGRGRVPADSEIVQALGRIGYCHVQLDTVRRTIHFDKAGIELDLGGIAKGYAVDRVVEILRAHGITRALVSSGTSSIYGLGAPPQERGWKVTVRDPFDAQKAGDVFYLRDFSISTSGNYEKFFKFGAKVYSHIMDPHTGRPVENMLSTAVLASQTTRSDALSTAFYVLGVEGGSKYLATHPNLLVVYYQPTASRGGLRRVVARSRFQRLPAGCLAEIEGR